MSSPLAMDARQLAANAAKLHNLVQERVQREQSVTDIAGQFAQAFKGDASRAMQQILDRYLTASEGLRGEEQAIAEKLDQAQKAYTATDSGSAHGISSAMGI